MTTWAQVQQAIVDSGTEPVPVVIERDGAERTVSVTAVEVERGVYDEQGKPVTDASGTQVTEKRQTICYLIPLM